jgi:hypothetical protein
MMIYELDEVERRVLRGDVTKTHESACDCPYHRLTEAERVELVDNAIDQTNAEVLAHGGYLLPTFADDWELAPLSMTRTTERECAEYWYECGRRAERVRVIGEQNEEMQRKVEEG